MRDYRIVCVKTKYYEDCKHEHILAVGTGPDLGAADRRWEVEEVRKEIKKGRRFYTVSPSTQAEANVRRFTCCKVPTIRSEDDAVKDNNLDQLPSCM